MNPDLMSAIVAESHHTPEAVLDLLLETGATLCDVLLAYAGTPPEWSDGLARDVLAGWLERTGDKERAAKVAQYDDGDDPAADAESWRITETLSVVRYHTFWPTEADARRYLKRRVLSLFPEAKTIQVQDWAIPMPVEVSAPDWIVPGYEELRRMPRQLDTDALFANTLRQSVADAIQANAPTRP